MYFTFSQFKNRRVVFFLAISNTGGNDETDLKKNHRFYSIKDFDDIIGVLQKKYAKSSILVILNLLSTPPKTVHVKVHEYLEIYNLHVKLWGAILDHKSEEKLKNIFQYYSTLPCTVAGFP